MRSSELVLSATHREHNSDHSHEVIWITLNNNITRNIILEHISKCTNGAAVIEQQVLMNTVAEIVNYLNEKERDMESDSATTPPRLTETFYKSVPLHLHWLPVPLHRDSTNKQLPLTLEIILYNISNSEIAHVNGVYHQVGIKADDSSPFFWNQKSNTFLQREIAEDGSNGWLVGTREEGVLVAAQSHSTNFPPLDGWTRVLKVGSLSSQMKITRSVLPGLLTV